MQKILFILLGYFLGSIQSAYIAGKIHGVDLRKKGSGNLGATNALRVLGKRAGILTLLFDAVKAAGAYLLAAYAFGGGAVGGLYAGLGAVLGHDFPFYLKFKGGKGIAVTVGVMFCFNPLAAGIITICAVIIIAVTKYVSLGSIFGMVAMAVVGIVMYHHKQAEVMLLVVLISTIAIVRHRTNIVRLIKGTENKLGQKKLKVEPENSVQAQNSETAAPPETSKDVVNSQSNGGNNDADKPQGNEDGGEDK